MVAERPEAGERPQGRQALSPLLGGASTILATLLNA